MMKKSILAIRHKKTISNDYTEEVSFKASIEIMNLIKCSIVYSQNGWRVGKYQTPSFRNGFAQGKFLATLKRKGMHSATGSCSDREDVKLFACNDCRSGIE